MKKQAELNEYFDFLQVEPEQMVIQDQKDSQEKMDHEALQETLVNQDFPVHEDQRDQKVMKVKWVLMELLENQVTVYLSSDTEQFCIST